MDISLFMAPMTKLYVDGVLWIQKVNLIFYLDASYFIEYQYILKLVMNLCEMNNFIKESFRSFSIRNS